MTDAVIRTQERALVTGQQFDPIVSLVLDGLTSEHSRRAYERALTDFLTWWSAQGKPPMSKAVVQRHRRELQEADPAPSTINQRLSAIRKLAQEASDNGLVDPHYYVLSDELLGYSTHVWEHFANANA